MYIVLCTLCVCTSTVLLNVCYVSVSRYQCIFSWPHKARVIHIQIDYSNELIWWLWIVSCVYMYQFSSDGQTIFVAILFSCGQFIFTKQQNATKFAPSIWAHFPGCFFLVAQFYLFGSFVVIRWIFVFFSFISLCLAFSLLYLPMTIVR